jgi:hypothetical protein
MVVDAVPFRADGWVAGRWSRRSHLRVGQDAQHRSPAIEDHSIDTVGEVGDLRLEVVNGSGRASEIRDGVDFAGEALDRRHLADEIHDRRVDLRLPLLYRVRLAFDGVEALVQVTHRRLEGRQPVAELLHLIEDQLRIWIHDAAQLLETGEMVVIEVALQQVPDRVSDTKC